MASWHDRFVERKRGRPLEWRHGKHSVGTRSKFDSHFDTELYAIGTQVRSTDLILDLNFASLCELCLFLFFLFFLLSLSLSSSLLSTAVAAMHLQTRYRCLDSRQATIFNGPLGMLLARQPINRLLIVCSGEQPLRVLSIH